MKIAINTRLILAGKLEGIGQFSFEIFDRLSKLHPEVEWLFLFDRPIDPSFKFADNVRCIEVFPPTRHAFLWHWWFQFSLKKVLRKEKVDLFLSPDGLIPLGLKIPSISVIHDLNFHHQPKNLPPIAGAYMRHFFPKFAQAAERVVTVSEFCRQDIHQSYEIDLAKIDLVYNGVNEKLGPLAKEAQNAVRAKYSQNQAYFIFVGALNPRKNIEGMLKAYQHYRDSGGAAHFILVGEAMLMTDSMRKAHQEHPYQNDIHFTGRIETEQLSKLIASAQALCLCSHLEGFGIPILEAFKCETALICADNSAMPEIAGDAALFCDAAQPESIGAAMLRSEDAETRESLIEKGQARLADFSWDRSASMMWSSIQKSMQNGQTA